MNENKGNKDNVDINLRISHSVDGVVKNEFLTIPQEIVKLIQSSKGISVTITKDDEPLFHCISNDSLNDMTELLDETQVDEIAQGHYKLISLF